MFQRQFFNIILFGKLLKEELGDEKAIELFKKLTYKDGLAMGKRRAEQQKDNGFQTFVERFKDPERYKYTLTKEVVEDSEKAFELKVTECLWATACLQQNAGDIGYAWICYGDYAVPQGFNPKIKMVRDKTLMQGHDCCNHRYILTD